MEETKTYLELARTYSQAIVDLTAQGKAAEDWESRDGIKRQIDFFRKKLTAVEKRLLMGPSAVVTKNTINPEEFARAMQSAQRSKITDEIRVD